MDVSLKRSKLFFMLCCLLTFLSVGTAQSQNANSGLIQGKVTTIDGGVAAYSTVKLSNGRSARVDKEGHYVFTALKSGSYIITVSFVGLPDQSKTLSVGEGESAVADFVLSANSKSMDEKMITDKKY